MTPIKGEKKIRSIDPTRLGFSLDSFLAGPPGVMLIKGPWGVGKTFQVTQYFQTLQTSKTWGYLSLFGTSDLKECRTKLLSNINHVGADIKQRPLILAKQWAQFIKKCGKDIRGGAACEAIFEIFKDDTVNDIILVIDDLERRDESLTFKQVLGFAADAAEQRKCHVVLIAHHEKLRKKDQVALKLFRERIVAKEISYDPSIEENFSLISPTLESHIFLKIFRALSINNIRIMQKSVAAANDVGRCLKKSESNRDQIIENTILFSALHNFDPKFDVGKVIDFEQREMMRSILGHSNASEDAPESHTDKLLKSLNYQEHPADVVLLNYVKNGFLDEAILRQELSKLSAEETPAIKLKNLLAEIRQSFSINDADILTRFSAICDTNWASLSLADLHAAGTICKWAKPKFDSKIWTNKWLETVLPTLSPEEIGDILDGDWNEEPFFFKILNQRKRFLVSSISFQEAFRASISNRYLNPDHRKSLESAKSKQWRDWLLGKDSPLQEEVGIFLRILIKTEGAELILNNVSTALLLIKKKGGNLLSKRLDKLLKFAKPSP